MAEHAGSLFPTHPRRLRSAQLLLVDDDPALLEALSGTLQLRLEHVTVDTCDTAIKALAYATDKQYDTIISDVNMPGMNGLEFLTLVRQVQPLAPVVLISGHADHVLVSKLLDAGAADFIAKPIERNIFIFTVRQTLNLSRLHALLERQQARNDRVRDHYMSVVEKLGQSNERWLGLQAENIVKGDSGNRPANGLLRREKDGQQMEIFTKRATRHLAILGAFLFDAAQTHRQTSEELKVAEEKLRRLASTRLQDSG
ncbi:MAG TPA: response regulator [Nitrospiraceae bacterium]|nr:response regulator [Nitrospiraceae bacterium]